MPKRSVMMPKRSVMVVMRMEMMMVMQQRVSNDQESSQLTKAQKSSSYNTVEVLHIL